MTPKNGLHQEFLSTDSDKAKLTDRALILLSFKDANTQNLRFILEFLGIRTHEEKQKVLQEIFRLIQKGIVYIPKGLPQLIDHRAVFNIDNLQEFDNIDLCLLCPYERLIQEIQKEIQKENYSK
ncbi:MAG: hypothetical protein JSV04_09035 [Candidatus Heimdallarchaeota archaeon]|nr:MAG: hypothetical protein JSV04_09035 [Candidatus Heimdallarchaeota archaeon]